MVSRSFENDLISLIPDIPSCSLDVTPEIFVLVALYAALNLEWKACADASIRGTTSKDAKLSWTLMLNITATINAKLRMSLTTEITPEVKASPMLSVSFVTLEMMSPLSERSKKLKESS